MSCKTKVLLKGAIQIPAWVDLEFRLEVANGQEVEPPGVEKKIPGLWFVSWKFTSKVLQKLGINPEQSGLILSYIILTSVVNEPAKMIVARKTQFSIILIFKKKYIILSFFIF